MTFWLWFVVPLGAPPIGLAIAVGGMMILRLALLDTSEAEAIIKEDKRTMRDRWVRTRWPRARQGRGARLRLGARGFRAVTFSALPLRYLRAG